mmetsp:Transcript_35200/g.80587  ORF Transcript_35200/g.80587 Transcript_35200/m.80587 type:complete len:429 (-) Transcript_35200:53-1339(-)
MQPPAAKQRRLQLLPKDVLARSAPPRLPELLREAWNEASSGEEESNDAAESALVCPDLLVFKDSDWANAISAAKRKDRAWSAVGLVKKVPISKTLLQCVHEWQGFEREPGRVKLEVLRLERETARAVLLRSGALLGLLLLRAVGGLRCESDANKWDELHYALSGVVLTCLIYLDFRCGARRYRPILRWICAVAATINANLQTARKVGKFRWQVIARVANQKLLQRAIPKAGVGKWLRPRRNGCHDAQGKCCVRDCCDAGDVSVAVADAVGPAGRRCWRHAVERLEDLPADTTSKLRSASTSSGQRHFLRQRCMVSACNSFACGTRLFADAFGPPGKRCRRHGSNECTMVGCARRCYSEKLLALQDGGQRGARCSLHGGPTCTVALCEAEPVITVKEEDTLGPSGPRCNRHSGYYRAKWYARAPKHAAN